MPHVAVGTSGWSYEHWAGALYPEGSPRSHWFEFYASRFSAVEVNYGFYRLPSLRTVESWRTRALEGFRFAAKGSQLITHRLRLRNCDRAVARFYERVASLGETLGVVLWQLPPDFDSQPRLLDQFLSKLPADVPVAIEFRNSSWYQPRVYEVLEDHHASLVWVSSLHISPVYVQTASLVYVRFHGLSRGFAHDYSLHELEPWVAALCGRTGYAFFNNDALARAPANAAFLRALLAETGSER